MKIEDKRINNRIYFKDLVLGECFQIGGHTYIRTQYISNDNDFMNCVRLIDGRLSYFDSTYSVERVDAKVVIGDD